MNPEPIKSEGVVKVEVTVIHPGLTGGHPLRSSWEWPSIEAFEETSLGWISELAPTVRVMLTPADTLPPQDALDSLGIPVEDYTLSHVGRPRRPNTADLIA